jgi:type II secretory pathway component PulF
MPNFQYRARDREGALVTGALEASDRTALEGTLDRMGLIPIRVSEAAPTSRRLPGVARVRDLVETIPRSEIIIFSRQFATLFGAGIPVTKALNTLEVQARSARFKRVIRRIREDVEGGSTLSAAIARHPKVFPEIYASMIEAGEAGGILEGVLDRLAYMLEKDSENRAKIKSATLYPKIVVVAIVLAVAVLMNFVVPKFARMYSSFNVELPLPTRALIFISDLFAGYWYVMLAVAVVVFAGLRLYVSTAPGRHLWDRLSLSMPVFGPLALKSIQSRFARVLGALYKSGLPILQALDIVSRAVENRVVSAEVKSIEGSVRAGSPLSEPMSASAHFPPMIVQMVAVGEETGNLDEMLEKAAHYFDQEVDSTIRNLTTLLEPMILIFIFGAVLFLALAIFLPMWDILKVVRR